MIYVSDMKITLGELKQVIKESFDERPTLKNQEPEYDSIEEFVEFCMDDDKKMFNLNDVQKLTRFTHMPNDRVIEELEDYGLTYSKPGHVKKVRGIGSNDHDRWSGPGSEKTHGGSGINVHGGQSWGSGHSNLK